MKLQRGKWVRPDLFLVVGASGGYENSHFTRRHDVSLLIGPFLFRTSPPCVSLAARMIGGDVGGFVLAIPRPGQRWRDGSVVEQRWTRDTKSCP
jgi:hypothetical protein